MKTFLRRFVPQKNCVRVLSYTFSGFFAGFLFGGILFIPGVSAEALPDLAFGVTPFSAESPKFLPGDRVTVTVAPLKVRDTAGGTVIGTQPLDTLGTIISGPVVGSTGNWWNINYDGTLDGWSFQTSLEKYISPNDTIAPAPVNISVENITPNSATLSWIAPGDDGNTGTASSYEIRYSRSLITNVNFGSATRVAVPPLPLLSGTMQFFTAGSLLPNTRYYFAIITKDEASNNSTLSNVASFTTATTPIFTDTIPPIISGITLSGFPNIITAQWITNELSDSQAVYGRSSTTLSNTVTVSGLVASHTLTFSELQRKATYYYKIISKDAAGNISTSPIGSFQTGPGKTAPIKNLRATQGSVILTWSPSIDEFAQKVVVYRSLSGYPDTMKASDLLATITDLTQTTYRDEAVTPGVTYYYSVFVIDNENTASDPVHTSFTPVAPPVSSGSGSSGGGGGGGGGSSSWGGGGGGGGGGFITTPSPVTPPKPPVIQNTSSRPQFHYSFAKTLSLGITDGEVQELQKALNILGYAIASEGPGSLGNETPYFGNATAAAIRKFQCDTMQICSGTPTTTGYGLVGKMTRAKLGEKLGTSGVVSVPVPQQNAPAAVAPTPRSFLITRALTLGMTGEDVRTLQNTLKAKGYFPAESETTIYFGQVTLGAIKKFQCDMMQICSGTLAETGYGNVGKMTRSKLGL